MKSILLCSSLLIGSIAYAQGQQAPVNQGQQAPADDAQQGAPNEGQQAPDEGQQAPVNQGQQAPVDQGQQAPVDEGQQIPDEGQQVQQQAPVEEGQVPNESQTASEQQIPGTAAEAIQQIVTSMCEDISVVQLTGDLNKDFASLLVIHHQAAIDLSKAYLTEGADAQLVDMANKIIQAQQLEIEALQAKLEELSASNVTVN